MIVESYEDIIRLSGALRSNQWETLHTAIALSLRRHPEGVILDCEGLTECNEKGAQTFYHVMEFLKVHDARVLVAAVPRDVMEVLRNVEDVRSQLPISETVDEARKSLYFFTGGELEDEERTSHKRDQVEAEHHFLVVVQGSECDHHLLKMAHQMARGMRALVYVMFPIIVPRELPIQSALPEEEGRAKTCLEKADQALDLDQVNHVLLLERGRDAASAVFSTLEQHACSHVFIGLDPEDDGQGSNAKMISSVNAKVQGSTVLFVVAPH